MQGRQHMGGGGAGGAIPLPIPHPPPLPIFCVAIRKKGNKRKKERVSKHCHQGQNVTVLNILERLEFKSLSYLPTMVAHVTFQYSMTPPL